VGVASRGASLTARPESAARRTAACALEIGRSHPIPRRTTCSRSWSTVLRCEARVNASTVRYPRLAANAPPSSAQVRRGCAALGLRLNARGRRPASAKEKVPGTCWARGFLAPLRARTPPWGTAEFSRCADARTNTGLRGEHAESSIPLLASGWQVNYAEVCRYYPSASSKRCNHDFRTPAHSRQKRQLRPMQHCLWTLPGLTPDRCGFLAVELKNAFR
jgi:hypothetical protein